jgi:predicted nucleic acid-binding protein
MLLANVIMRQVLEAISRPTRTFAAIALEHDDEVVSCDSDFGKFPGLKSFNPVTGVRSPA